MKTRKASASLAILLSAGLGLAACGTAAEDTAKEAVASASAAVSKGLSDEDKAKLNDFIKDYFSTARTIELPSDGLPEDIKAIEDKIQSAEDSTSLSEIVEAIDSSGLSDEEKQKLDDYFKDLDPTSDMFDRSDLSTSQSIALGMLNMGFGTTFSLLDENAFTSLQLDTDKVEFGDDSAKTSADSFSLEDANQSAEASESASTSISSISGEMGLEVAKTLFDGVEFKFVDGEWKIDAPSYLNSIEKQVEKSSASASASE